MATLTRMIASRDRVTTVSQTGMRDGEAAPQVSAMKDEVSRILSATGSSMAPERRLLPAEPRDQAVEQVGEPRHHEDDERPAHPAAAGRARPAAAPAPCAGA